MGEFLQSPIVICITNHNIAGSLIQFIFLISSECDGLAGVLVLDGPADVWRGLITEIGKVAGTS